MLTDRAQGGASLSSGQLEVMLHRRTLFDDQRGVAEPLNETMQGCRDCHSAGLVARGRHWLTVQASLAAARLYQIASAEHESAGLMTHDRYWLTLQASTVHRAFAAVFEAQACRLDNLLNVALLAQHKLGCSCVPTLLHTGL